jgi:hypothetical protein
MVIPARRAKSEMLHPSGARRAGSARPTWPIDLSNHWFSTSRGVLGEQLTANFIGQSYGGRLEGGLSLDGAAGGWYNALCLERARASVRRAYQWMASMTEPTTVPLRLEPF